MESVEFGDLTDDDVEDTFSTFSEQGVCVDPAATSTPDPTPASHDAGGPASSSKPADTPQKSM